MSSPRGSIRSEAQPADWNNLNSSQKQAVIEILETLESAVLQLPSQRESNQRDYENRHSPCLSWNRASRISFLDGQRGTGKSTVLISVLNFISKGEITGATDGSGRDAESAMKTIRNRVVMLEPIDMEPVPRHWNMLPAILARIEEAFSRYSTVETNNGITPGLLTPSNHYHDAQRNLQQLQNNITLSWDGNLNERAAQLDPDAYAQETMRNERARINLNPNISKVLDQLAKQISQCSQIDNPIFLLPIDDFDLNPGACLEMLRILRMISVSRLFTLVLGDLEVVDVVLNLKQSANLSAIYSHPNQKMLSVIPAEISMLAGRISSHALHKLLPPLQCIGLYSLAKHETLNYRPLGENDNQSLFKSLDKCKVRISNDFSFFNNEDENLTSCINSLSNLLLIKGFYILSGATSNSFDFCIPTGTKEDKTFFCREDLTDAIYSGLSILNTTPRFAADLWGAFKRFSLLADTGAEIELGIDINLIAQLCRNQLLRDSALTPSTRSRTRGGFFSRSLGEWDLEALPLITRSVIDGGRSISISAQQFEQEFDVNCSVLAYTSIGWRFRLKREQKENSQGSRASVNRDATSLEESDEQIEYMHPGEHCLSIEHLALDSTGALILFHDLLSLGSNYRFNSFLLPSEISIIRDSWCKTLWKQGAGLEVRVELPWPAPLCRSFLGLDLFLSAWNRLLKETVLSTEELAFIWISAGTAAITSSLPIMMKDEDNEVLNWKELGDRLADIIPEAETIINPILEKQIQIWLVSVALMIMPESGLPNISAMYLNQNDDKLLKYWYTCRRPIRTQRYARLKKIYKAEMEELAKKLYNTFPYGLDTKREVSIKDTPIIIGEELKPKNFSKNS